MENSFCILVKQFRMLLTTMEQRPNVVRDIVLTCVVLHNMLRSHLGGADRPPTQADDIQPPQGDQGGTETSRELEGGQTSMRPTERLLQSHGGAAGWAVGQSLRRLREEN